MVGKDIFQQLYDLRRTQKESFLEMVGVDVTEVRKLEAELGGQFDELFSQLRDSIRDTGQDIVKQHDASLQRSYMLFEAAKQPVPPALKEAPEWFLGYFEMYLPCYHPNLATFVGHTSSVTFFPPAGTGSTGSVDYDAATDPQLSRPLADSQGQGTGTDTSALVSSKFRFAFTPDTDRTYCILPIVFMSGHWLLWTWASCDGTPESRGVGSVRIKLRIQVDQLSVPIKSKEHIVLSETHAEGPGIESGFAYDSQADGGAAMQVFLQGGHEAVVWVECEINSQMANRGRAWVDMQSSPSFYFRVPELRWGWQSYAGWFEMGHFLK